MTEANPTQPLVLIPGFSLTASFWEQVAGGLPNPPIFADVPGDLDFPSTAEAVCLPGPARYAGYSMGGRLALQIALDHPDRVTALALISTSPGIADPAARARRRREDDELAGWIGRAGRDAFLDRWLAQPLFAGVDPETARTHRLQSASDIADQLRRLGVGAHEPMWERLPELEQPVLIVAGERDEQYCAIATQMAERIGVNAALHVVPGAGHALPIERPDALAVLLNRFS